MVVFRELKAACTEALAGKRYSQDIGVDKVDKSLVSNFEILNLVPEHTQKDLDAAINRTQEATGRTIDNRLSSRLCTSLMCQICIDCLGTTIYV